MKTCTKCQKEKPFAEFYKHPTTLDGFGTRCIQCIKEYSRQRLQEQRKRPDWAEREALRQAKRRQKRREEHPLRFTLRPKQSRKKERWALGNAVRDGRVLKLPCQVCGKERSEGHHEDYSKPLDVVWLCKRHHVDRHMHLYDSENLGRKPMPINDFIEELKAKKPNHEHRL